jgi:hypothetical protein
MAKRLVAPGLALALAAAPAAAQPPPNPGNMPSGPAPRPIGMGEQDSATMPSARDQIVQGTARAAADRAADSARRERARPATPAEIVAGSLLSDNAGEAIGTVESVSADGAVVSNGTVRVMVPLDAFGIAGSRLMLGITKAEFDAAAAGAQAQP